MSIKFVAAGDAMLVKEFPKGYDCKELKSIIDEAQLKAVNVEMVLSNRDCHASTFCGGSWVNSNPENFTRLKQYGFNLFSCANNHSMDYSFDGLLSTCNVLEHENTMGGGKKNYAGIGKDLKEASEPAYITVQADGREVKVALISLTTTFIDAARAGYANQYFPGRPGVNALRHKEVYFCTEDQMETLKAIAADTFINGERDNARKIGSLPPEVEGTLNFGGIFFRVSDKKGKMTTCHEADMKRIMGSIIEAKTNADYVIVMPHSHNIKHGSYTEPDYFFEEFCHKCIDEGADCVLGGGTHQLKPVEIYNNKPIFYSLGNFIFQTHLVDAYPYDFWEKYNYPPTLSIEEARNIKTKGGTIGLDTDKHNYLSVLPTIEFQDGVCKGIELTVISLQFEKDKEYKGLPIVANKNDADYVFNYLEDISLGYGTQFRKNGNKIIVEINK